MWQHTYTPADYHLISSSACMGETSYWLPPPTPPIKSPTCKQAGIQTGRQTKCITTLTHHPLTNSQTRKMYHRLVNRQAGRRADKMYYHTCASPSHKQTDRQMDEMYYCTPTSPTREQSDGQTKYVSPSHEQAGRQAGGQTKHVSPHSHGASDGLNNLNGGLPAGQVGCLHADPCTGANRRKNGHAQNLPSLVKVHHQPITQPRLVDCTLSGQGHTD